MSDWESEHFDKILIIVCLLLGCVMFTALWIGYNVK